MVRIVASVAPSAPTIICVDWPAGANFGPRRPVWVVSDFASLVARTWAMARRIRWGDFSGA